MQTEKSLLKFALEYLEAITNNDIERLLLSPDLKVTYNGIKTTLAGSPVWGAPRRIPFRQTFADPETGSVVFFGVITNTTTRHAGFAAKWWLCAIRLKIDNNEIVEIEEIATDSIFAHFEKNFWELRPNLAFNYPLAERARSTREEMVEIVECYWRAVEGNIDSYDIPFHPDAVRSECGTITTDAKNFPNSARGDFTKVTNDGWRWDVVNRRYPVIDTDRGIVISFVDLITTGQTNPDFLPCIVAEIFKIENGLLKDIFAVFYAGENRSDW